MLIEDMHGRGLLKDTLVLVMGEFGRTPKLNKDAGQIVAANDDHAGSPDSRLDVALPKAGTYYLSLIDAHDTGGPAHVFRLTVR